MHKIAVITTFPNNAWPIYGKRMLESFVKYWPADVDLCVELDDDLLLQDVQKILRPNDAVAPGWTAEHKAFVERNKGKDDPQDYRKQAVRFCHKVFAIHRAYTAIKEQKEHGEGYPRYLIWLDADVLTTKQVTHDDLLKCLPKEGDAVAYLGRKDWDHSECGWLAFDLEKGGDKIIEAVYSNYLYDKVFSYEQWHDSWIWDRYINSPERTVFTPNGPIVVSAAVVSEHLPTNLTADKPGMEIWQHSPMAAWSTHYKGPVAKQQLAQQPVKQAQQRVPITIQTKNSIPDASIQANIKTNQELITNWIRLCADNDETIVVVSAGPQLIAEDVRKEVEQGRRIVAVKHAVEPLNKAGITPWAVILLDPREHVRNFVEKPDNNIIWIVASQVNPEVTKRLIDAGCTVWGYHAPVGAGEGELIAKQPYAQITGGSATATRGLYVLRHLGFKKFRLYGYDLCYPDKVDMNEKTAEGAPKYLEMSVGLDNPFYNVKKCFWTEPQFIAQFEEINEIIKSNTLDLEAFGEGVIPFIIKAKRTGELRMAELKAKIHGDTLTHYSELLECSKMKKTTFLTKLLRKLPLTRRRTILSKA